LSLFRHILLHKFLQLICWNHMKITKYQLARSAKIPRTLRMNLTILAWRMKLIHCPCGAPKEVFTYKSDNTKGKVISIIFVVLSRMSPTLEFEYHECAARVVFSSMGDISENTTKIIYLTLAKTLKNITLVFL
jgi:hypothetical protein